MEAHNCTIEMKMIPLKKATYEDIQALNINLQTQLFVKDKEIDRLKKEIYQLNLDKIDLMETGVNCCDKIRNLYKSRNDKAIEYIKDYFYINEETGEYYLTHTFDKSNLYELYDILKGENNE